ncbi:MAG: tetratricopeptide repeat protein [Bacteroidetes bacterium]|nr:tetratricopeptide repeat protein [Bacteroidota bacterium]
MINQDYIRQKIKILEICSPVDVSKQCLAILESFITLDRPEQKEFAEAIYAMAEKNAAHKPLLFCYAKLVLAFSLFYREQYEEAFPMLTEAQNSFTDLNDPDGAAVSMVIQAGIYRTFGNVDLALKASWAAHERLVKSESLQHFLMACNINMASIYLERHHDDKAIPLFSDTLEMAKKTNKYYWVVYALHGLGKVYLGQKKYSEAQECFEQAMEASERYGNPVSVSNSLSELGNYYFAEGDYEKAEHFHQQSLALREQNGYTGGAITSCIRLGEIYMQHHKTGEAIEILNKGLQLADKINVKVKMYPIHKLLSKIYESKNEWLSSLSHFKQFHDLHEQVEMEDNARKIRNAQMIFEVEQTQKENAIIKKQKAEIEKKNIELQETIDKLTRARIGKKARAITLFIAIVLFILEDFILHFALSMVNSNNYFISIAVKMVIIFSLGPINKTVEAYLLNKVIKKKREVLV